MATATKTKPRKRTVQNVATTSAAPLPMTTKFAIGEDVAHPQFGDGTVTDIEGDKLTIKFTDGRVKQILDYYIRGRRLYARFLRQ